MDSYRQSRLFFCIEKNLKNMSQTLDTMRKFLYTKNNGLLCKLGKFTLNLAGK